MNRNPKGSIRTFALALLVTGPLAVLGVFSAAQPATKKAQEASVPTAGEKYKNIKVLKNLPADQLIPFMHKYNNSLGVRCDFCHVIGPNHTLFEKDDKPEKTMARKMILLTIELNKKKVLGGQATCFMCHNGHPEPITQAPAEPERRP